MVKNNCGGGSDSGEPAVMTMVMKSVDVVFYGWKGATAYLINNNCMHKRRMSIVFSVGNKQLDRILWFSNFRKQRRELRRRKSRTVRGFIYIVFVRLQRRFYAEGSRNFFEPKELECWS